MTYTYKLSRRLAVELLTSDQLSALLQSPIARHIFYFVIVAIGCAAGRMFPFQRQFQGSREFLEHMFPGHSAVFYERADFFVTCIMGAILGTLIVQPTTVHTALLTGLGWPFIIRFLIEGMKEAGSPPPPPSASGGKPPSPAKVVRPPRD